MQCAKCCSTTPIRLEMSKMAKRCELTPIRLHKSGRAQPYKFVNLKGNNIIFKKIVI